MKVGAFSCESRSNAKNMLKMFEMKYHLEMYEVVRPMFDPKGYAREVLQIGGTSNILPQLKIIGLTVGMSLRAMIMLLPGLQLGK